MLGIERNKDPELPMKQRNTSWFVILDDRKHGRAGKFPVFYDIDTGDYLEPPEGFLDSPYETLREWYAVHPEDDPSSPEYKEKMRDASQPLSPENQDKTLSDLTESDIPKGDESESTNDSAFGGWGSSPNTEPENLGKKDSEPVTEQSKSEPEFDPSDLPESDDSDDDAWGDAPF